MYDLPHSSYTKLCENICSSSFESGNYRAMPYFPYISDRVKDFEYVYVEGKRKVFYFCETLSKG